MTHREKIYAAEESVWPPCMRRIPLDTLVIVVNRLQPNCNVAARLVPEPKESCTWWFEEESCSLTQPPDVPWLYVHPKERTLHWILHELAHVRQGPDDPREHSRLWLAHYLRLVRGEGMPHVARHLRRALVPLVTR